MNIEGNLHFFLVKLTPRNKEILEKCEKLIKENVGSTTELKWVSAEECLQMEASTLAKTDIFIFPEFKGAAFDHIRTPKKALVLGPPSLTKCLVDKIPIPEGPPPCIYNAAMFGLVISLSGFKESDKTNNTEYISFMGGLCMGNLPVMCTHLVSNTVLSAKYEAAVKQKIPVMQPEWIEEVWKKNTEDYVAATDSQFDVFKLPVFHKLAVSCTSLGIEDKIQVEKLIVENGGAFHGTYKPQVVNILILNENGKSSAKFKAASKGKKPCLTPQWVFDSVKKGFALPFEEYIVQGEVRVSTPKKNAPTNPEFSVSHIQGSGNTTVNESLRSKNMSMMSEIAGHNLNPAEQTKIEDDYYKDCVKNLTITNAKRSGSFLDGCNIFFSGFTPSEMNKLNKIVSLSGATRFDEVDENVSHVIIGKRIDKELKAFQGFHKGIHFVKVDWLKESMNAQQPVGEEEHCYELAVVANKTQILEQPSPASKKNIAAMNSSFKKPLPRMADLSRSQRKPTDEEELDMIPKNNNLLNRYLQSSDANMEPVERVKPAAAAAPEATTSRRETSQRREVSQRREISQRQEHDLQNYTMASDLNTEDFENLNFFTGKLFGTQNSVSQEEHRQMITDITNFGGKLVEKGYKGEIDYLVTPSVGILNFKPEFKAKNMVCNLWLEDVLGAREEIPIEYFHKVIGVKDDTVFKDIHCVISTYGGTERIYLTLVCQALGGIVEEKYAKNKMPVLICEKPEGSKYKGAVNWEYPCVTKDWVMDSFHKNYLHKLEDYIIGDSKVKHQIFVDINNRGIHKGADPPSLNTSDIIPIRSESPLLSQVPPSPASSVHLKRKSDDLKDDMEDDAFLVKSDKKFKSYDELVLLPNRSPSKNNRVMALRSESKSTTSPTTPISQHMKEVAADFGYDTPRRKQLYDVLKETNNLTPRTPHTPAVMKMPKTLLHPDPEATPGQQWNVYQKFSGFLEKPAAKKKKKMSPGTPISEIKRRFWKQALGEDTYNSTMLNINSQLLDVKADETRLANTSANGLDVSIGAAGASTSARKSLEKSPQLSHSGGEGEGFTEAVKGLTEFISKRKSEPKKAIENLETCPVVCPEMENQDPPDIMVGWAETDEVLPFNSSREGRSSFNANTSKEANPYFLTSGVECPDSIVQAISQLRGEIHVANYYDPRCTHLICAKIGRVEKVLCALAAGKWILSLKYVEDSAKANRFLDEEAYQWGNPNAEMEEYPMTAIESKLAHSAYLWRLKITDTSSSQYSRGVFQGFRVLMWSKTEGFKRIITAGGGECLDVGDSYKDEAALAKTATMCLVERKLPFPPANLQFCKVNGIKVCDIQYMNEYLMNGQPPNPQQFEFKG